MKKSYAWGIKRCVVLLLAAGTAAHLHAQVRTVTDSTRPVASPDGKRTIVVDRIFRVVDGELERYPSRMLVRITEVGSTVTRQRLIDASQVRLLNPPRWLDDRWAAFTYNISKNANGVVYVDSASADALQLEFVALRRRMAGSDTIEVELTSFEVTDYGQRITRIPNVTRRNRSVFPLFLRPLPPYDTTPFPGVYAEQVRKAVKAYHDFLEKNKIRSLRLEEASESFSPEDKMLAVLSCVDGKPAALLCPLEAESPAAALERVHIFPLDPNISLTCLSDAGAAQADTPTSSTISEDSEVLGHFGEYRFRTSWKDEATALVEQEFFESEEQEPHREPLYALHLDGRIEKIAQAKISEGATSATLKDIGKSDDTPTSSVNSMETSFTQAALGAMSPEVAEADSQTTAMERISVPRATATPQSKAQMRQSKPTIRQRGTVSSAKKQSRTNQRNAASTRTLPTRRSSR
ncbi:MAG: hypothetical protein ACP5UB_04220 [Candidatus Sumerlaeaceae bacterium]